MNSKGQFLLYDILLAVFILFIVLIAVCSVPGQQDDYGIDYSEPGDTLNLLASMKVHDEVLLFALSEDDNDAASMVEGLIDGGYTLKDLTLHRTLSTRRVSSYHDVISARRVVEGHEYELSFYV